MIKAIYHYIVHVPKTDWFSAIVVLLMADTIYSRVTHYYKKLVQLKETYNAYRLIVWFTILGLVLPICIFSFTFQYDRPTYFWWVFNIVAYFLIGWYIYYMRFFLGVIALASLIVRAAKNTVYLQEKP